MSWQIIISSLLACAAVGGLAWVFFNTARDVSYITLADGRRQERSLPLMIRAMLPFCNMLPGVFLNSPFLEDSRNRVKGRLVSSGYEGLIHAHEIIALRLLIPLGIGVPLSLLLHLSFPHMPKMIGSLLAGQQVLLYFLVMVLLVYFPDSWLKRVVKIRHRQIERALPFVLDLLTLSVESGLDFMSGINRIISQREVDPLMEELIRVFREIQVGRSRKEALRNMAVRVNHADVRSLTNALIQADELGTGIGHALRIQADQMRSKRFQRAEKMGNEAPVKLLFPLVAFIFPSVFIVLMGPIILQMIIRGGF